MFIGLEFEDVREVAALEAVGRHQRVHGAAGARAGVADAEGMLAEVLDAVGFDALAGNEGERFGIEGQHGTQLAVGAGLAEWPQALAGVILHVGLHQAQGEPAVLEPLDVGDRSIGGLDGAALSEALAFLVDEVADGTAGGVVDAGGASGADGDDRVGVDGTGQGGRNQKRQTEQCRGGGPQGMAPRNGAMSRRGTVEQRVQHGEGLFDISRLRLPMPMLLPA